MNRSPMLAGLTYALVLMLIGTIIASFVLAGTNWPESSWLGATFAIHAVSLFVGGIATGKRSESKGWYRGSLLGLMYTVVIFIIGFLAYDGGFSKELLWLSGLALGAGALGGAIGVNLKK